MAAFEEEEKRRGFHLFKRTSATKPAFLMSSKSLHSSAFIFLRFLPHVLGTSPTEGVKEPETSTTITCILDIYIKQIGRQLGQRRSPLALFPTFVRYVTKNNETHLSPSVSYSRSHSSSLSRYAPQSSTRTSDPRIMKPIFPLSLTRGLSLTHPRHRPHITSHYITL